MGRRNTRVSFGLSNPHLTDTGEAMLGSYETRVFCVSSRPLSYDGVVIYPQELNLRKITVSSDKHKFGVQLRAEPDNQTLGRRLKGAFKQVSQAIKGIT